MRRFTTLLALLAVLAMASPAAAQDYRSRVQGAVLDETRAALPGVTVTLTNEATGVKVVRVSDTQGRYLFDFVEPGTYSVTAELSGFKKAERTGIRVQQRGDVTADLTLSIGTLEETVTVMAESAQVQLNSSNAQLTLERQLIDQMPLSGRNPYNLAMLDPTFNPGVGTTANENRPYHHAFANDYDAGGGTRRANDVLLDGVPLGASYKTAYTPSMDAVEEITVSKTSADAEHGHSLGGIISLNMKSGTNEKKGSAYFFTRDPSMNSRADPTIVLKPGQDTSTMFGTELTMFGGTFGFPIRKNKIFSFTSYEQWDDKRPLTVVRTVPTELERKGDFSQSLVGGKVRTIYNPFSSVVDPATNRVVRTAFSNNQIPSSVWDAVAVKMLAEIPLPNVAGNVDNLQYGVYDKTDYWNLSQRIDINFSDNWKMFVRYGQFKADLAQQNPTEAGYFPLSGSKRYGMSTAADVVWLMSNKTTLNLRGSYYNMTDDFYNPSLLLGMEGLEAYWPGNPWYKSLYNSGYVYHPALDVNDTGTGTTNRLGRQGREWYQHPDAWTASARMNWYEGQHNMKWGGDLRVYYGEAARFEPINWVFNSALTANSSDSPDTANTGNRWASFLLGALDGNSSARLVPLQTVNLTGYAAYFQDDWRVNDRLTLNLGLRWEYEPGPVDPENRLSQRLDLTQPNQAMQATPPAIPQQARDLMASKGYSYKYNGAWIFATKDNPHAWHATPWNFLPRVGVNYRLGSESVFRFAYARYMMPTSNVRETLGAFVDQYAGYAQTTNTLGLANGVPRQTLANPFPAGVNPVIEPYGQNYGVYTNVGGASGLDQYELRPQINDRFNFSYQQKIFLETVIDLSYFYNRASRVPYSIDLNMMDPAFKYEYKTLLNTQVANPFRNYLPVNQFPGALRSPSTVRLDSLLKPYPHYSSITQNNTNGKKAKAHTFEIRAQRPYVKGFSFVASYSYSNEQTQEWLDDIATYKTLIEGSDAGWTWRPAADVPRHRVTGALSWQLPVGKGRAIGGSMPTALDLAIGGWQYSLATRWYSGRPLFFGKYAVSGSPKIDNPTRDRWFDTSKFAIEDTYIPRTNPMYHDGVNGPGWTVTDMTLTKMFSLGSRYRLEARIEAYNAFNTIIWDNPTLDLSSANFGKVTRKRVDGNGRELQMGLRFIF
ncbi:MAG: carboxypeptidase regulatory-like domain-containing protein [Vicinamibacterales bacterium]